MRKINNSNAIKNNNISGSNITAKDISLSKKLKIPNVEERLVSFILDEIVDQVQKTKFSDIGNIFNCIFQKSHYFD